MSKYMVFIGIGFELLAMVGLGIYISSELEKKFASNGLITVGIITLCLVIWLIHLVILMKKVMNQNGK